MGPQHAYGLAARLEQVAEHPLTLNQGTLYPALVRLEQKGWIKGIWQRTETNREAKDYEITKAGLRALEQADRTVAPARRAGRQAAAERDLDMVRLSRTVRRLRRFESVRTLQGHLPARCATSSRAKWPRISPCSRTIPAPGHDARGGSSRGAPGDRRRRAYQAAPRSAPFVWLDDRRRDMRTRCAALGARRGSLRRRPHARARHRRQQPPSSASSTPSCCGRCPTRTRIDSCSCSHRPNPGGGRSRAARARSAGTLRRVARGIAHVSSHVAGYIQTSATLTGQGDAVRVSAGVQMTAVGVSDAGRAAAARPSRSIRSEESAGADAVVVLELPRMAAATSTAIRAIDRTRARHSTDAAARSSA